MSHWKRTIFVCRNQTALLGIAVGVLILFFLATIMVYVPYAYAYSSDSEISGATRYETAVAVSRQTYPDHADTVIVATGADFPDALCGAGVAGMVDGPILLSAKGVLPASTRDEIIRLNPSKVYVMGGTGAVGDEVVSSLERLVGAGSVQRLGGVDRVETAESAYESCVGWSDTVIIATGANYPDALSISPYAVSENTPILLTGNDGTLTPSTEALLAEAFLEGACKHILIVGGEGVVASDVEERVRVIAGASAVTIERLSGDDRFETSSCIAQWCVAAGFSWDGLAITTGYDFPDALTGGVLQGSRDSVMVLVAEFPSAVTDTLKEQRLSIDTLYWLGGTGATTPVMRSLVLSAVTGAQQSLAASLKVGYTTDQVVIVQSSGGSSATISFHQKGVNGWLCVWSESGYVGVQGISAAASEWASFTPEGNYGFDFAFGMFPDPGSILPYRPVTSNDYWVDDPDSPYYNTWVNNTQVAKDWDSAEHLSSYSVYNYALAIDYNSECVPGKGSAIFLHISNNRATAGCVSVSENRMRQLIQTVDDTTRIVMASGDRLYLY